jgi:hypothetical protein
MADQLFRVGPASEVEFVNAENPHEAVAHFRAMLKKINLLSESISTKMGSTTRCIIKGALRHFT